MTERVYISGPITGVPDYREHFQDAADTLITMGHDPVNPAAMPDMDSWESYMYRDLIILRGCNHVAMLEGWEQSRGANLEHQMARAYKIPVVYFVDGVFYNRVDESVLDEAKRLARVGTQTGVSKMREPSKESLAAARELEVMPKSAARYNYLARIIDYHMQPLRDEVERLRKTCKMIVNNCWVCDASGLVEVEDAPGSFHNELCPCCGDAQLAIEDMKGGER